MSISSVGSFTMPVSGRPDMDLATESKRILYVLDKTIARAKFVGVLKSLVADDGYLLSDILDSDDHFFIVQICNKYEFTGVKFPDKWNSVVESTVEPGSERKTKVTVEKVNSALASLGGNLQEEEEEGETSSSSSSSSVFDRSLKVANRVDNELSKVILLLEDYPKVVQLAERLQNELSPQMRFFISCLREFRHGIALHLGESAEQEKARLAYLRECYIKNEGAKKEIERLEAELLEHKTDANYCVIGRNVLINRHQNKINRIKKASMEAIDKRIRESERAMANDWRASTAVQEQLKSELSTTKQQYEHILRDDLAVEKTLRAKRAKVENQLLGWLQKFDQDIGEKQAEEEEIQELLDKQNADLEKIRLKLEEQEEEYDELMQEKAEFEMEMLERRLYVFILNRSARRIQRYFRLYKARKTAKKKAKKEKGKGKKDKGKKDKGKKK